MMRGMKTSQWREERLRWQGLTAPEADVAGAAARLLAVQSQDFTAGRWALAVRTKGDVRLRDVDAAFDRGDLVRAWTMRGTLHTIPARDVGWVLEVTAARQQQQAASRQRQLGIDDAMIDAVVRELTPRLRDGGLTRSEIFAVLEGIGIDPSGQRGIHLLFAMTVSGVLVQGPVVPREGITREQRFVLAADHIRDHARPEDPLAELFVRYVEGHGPAGVADFAWWSGLTLGRSREAAERAAPRVTEVDEGVFVGSTTPRRAAGRPSVFALGAFDEYYISYADRTVVCAPEHLAAVGPGKNGMVRATVVEHGRVIGCWTHAAAAHTAAPTLFEPPEDPAAVTAALARFAAFIG